MSNFDEIVKEHYVEEAWKLMEAALKSSNIKKEREAALPPLITDALVQTDLIARNDEDCQTEKSFKIDCEVQANPERRSFCTQTMKLEAEIPVDLPNLPSSSSSEILQNDEISSTKSLVTKTLSQRNHRTIILSPTGSQKSKKRKIDASLSAISLKITRAIMESILHNPKQFTQINTDNPVHLCTFLKVNHLDPWP